MSNKDKIVFEVRNLTKNFRSVGLYGKTEIIKALNNPLNPSLADRLVQKYSCQFVEISWILKKTTT